MQINKISDSSSLDSYFEIMNRFNKKASILGSLADLVQGTAKMSKLRGLSGPGADVLRQIAGESEIKAILQAFDDGSEAILSAQARAGSEEVKGLIHHLRTTGGDLSELGAKNKADLVIDFRKATTSVPAIIPPHKGGLPVLRELVSANPPLREIIEVIDSAAPRVDDFLRSRAETHQTINILIQAIKSGEDISPAMLAELTEKVAKNSDSIERLLLKSDEIAKATENLPAGLPDDARKAAITAADEAIESTLKPAINGTEDAAKEIAELETEIAAAAAKTGSTPSPELASTVDAVKKGIISDAVKLEQQEGKIGKAFKKIKQAGWALTIGKWLGFGALAVGVWKGYKYLTKDNGRPPGTSAPRSIGGDPAEKNISTEDAIKAYLETGDTAVLAGILSNSRYSNLMIFPDPIDGLSFAFFDSGRLRSPDERVLIPTHPETQAVLNSINGIAGGKVLDYERSKASSPQVALNKAVQAIYQYGFYATPLGNTRASKYIMGRAFKPFPRRGFLGRKAERISPAQRRERRPGRRMTASDNSNRLGKLDILNKISLDKSVSTNNRQNTDVTLFKEADETSKSYYKDAVKDLDSSDKLIREYFAGLGRLYDEKSGNPKTDFSSLYNITDGSGSKLTHEAHPKAVVVLDSIGNGGLAENGLEQKEQNQGVAMRAPTGNYRSNYAWVRNMLEKKGSK